MTKENEKMMALEQLQENMESFLSEWYSVSDLFQKAANAGSILLNLVVRNPKAIAHEELRTLNDLIDQHVMMADLLNDCEKIIKNGGLDKDK